MARSCLQDHDLYAEFSCFSFIGIGIRQSYSVQSVPNLPVRDHFFYIDRLVSFQFIFLLVQNQMCTDNSSILCQCDFFYQNILVIVQTWFWESRNTQESSPAGEAMCFRSHFFIDFLIDLFWCIFRRNIQFYRYTSLAFV